MSRTPDNYRYIGQPMVRAEDDRLLRGQGQFTDDFSRSDQAWLAVVRCPHAHAKIVSIDAGPAMSLDGVLMVLTGDDAQADQLNPIDHNPLPKTRFDMKLRGADDTDVFVGPHAILPRDKARHVGEAVAVVLAQTRELAQEAADVVAVEYDVLPAVIGTADAAHSQAGSVWDEVADNVYVDTEFGSKEATDAAFNNAAHVVHGEYSIARVTGVPLEPRSALGEYDAGTGRYTLYAGSGGAVKQKREIANVLNVDVDDVRVLSHDVGGNFGTRNRTYIEFVAVLWASKKLNRPVKFTATRSEAFLTDYQGRDFVSRVSLALDETGKFLALRADNISNGGARCVSLSPLGKGSALITGSYDIPVAHLRARAVFTNTMPTQAYRSSGRPEVTYVIERLVDKAALELGFDALELKRANLVRSDAMPYTNAVGARYDSGEYEACMDEILEVADWKGFEERRLEAQSRDRLLGRGFANYVESSIGAPKERADITVSGAGRVTVVIGTQPSGQGHETSFAQVAADLLEIDYDRIDIVYSDTDVVTLGGGSHSGRSMRHAGVVIGQACAAMVAQCIERGSEQFEVSADSVEYEGGVLRVPGTDISRNIFELAEMDPTGKLFVRKTNEMHDPVFPNGAAVCELEIDPDTGDTMITRYACIDDVGRAINPLILHGQAHGAIVQGVGEAMGEEIVLDPQSGQVLTGTFMDYHMPRAMDFPMFDTVIKEVISPTNPLGVKAGGEGGTTPSLAVYVAAVVDALKGYGVTDMVMPVTPASIVKAIRQRNIQTAK